MTAADVVFTVLFLASIGLAMAGGALWVEVEARRLRRVADPHRLEHRIGRWN